MNVIDVVISSAIAMVIGLYTINVVFNAIPYSGYETAEDNATRAAVKTAVNTVFGLLVVVLTLYGIKAVRGAS